MPGGQSLDGYRPPHDRLRWRQYYEFRIVEDRVLPETAIASLLKRHPDAWVTPTSLVLDATGTIGDREQDRLLRMYFDACLHFHVGGARSVSLRVATSQLGMAAVRPY
jgi:hypothetical protein